QSLLEPEAPGRVAQRRLSSRLDLFGSNALIAVLAGLVLAGCGLLRPPLAAPPPAPAPGPPPLPPTPPLLLRLDTVPFAELDGWAKGDPRGALQAFLRSCAVLAAKPDEAPLGGLSYAGTALEWRQVCGAASLVPSNSAEPARRFFELEFV